MVTAREILGLLNFGYAFEDIGPWQFMISKSYVKSASADLVKYEHHIKRKEKLKTAKKLIRGPRQ